MTTDTGLLFPDLFDKPLKFNQEQGSRLKAAERTGWSIAVPPVPSASAHRLRRLQRAKHLAATPSTSCCSAATRWRASHWPRSRRCRGSRTQPAAARSTMGCELAARVVERHRRRLGRVRRITIDLDPTATRRTAAVQSMTTGVTTLEPEQICVRRCCGTARRSPPTRLLPLLRCAHGRAFVRLDGGFASPALFESAMASNAVLLRHAEPAMLVARAPERAAPSISTWTPTMRRARGERAPGHHQGRSRPSRGPRAAGQPAFRGDEHAARRVFSTRRSTAPVATKSNQGPAAALSHDRRSLGETRRAVCDVRWKP